MSIVNFYLNEDLEDIEKQFIRAAIKSDIDEAKKIIEEEPAVVNYQDESTGVTGLMIFVSDGCGSMVDHICSLPATDVTIEDKFGRSAGLMAITVGRPDIGSRIDQRLKEDIIAFDPSFFDDEKSPETVDSKIVSFPSPKAGLDPKP